MLYALGSNGSGQLGLGHDEDLSRPELVQIPCRNNIKQIAAGGNHAVILFDNGDVYTCGNDGTKPGESTMSSKGQAHRLRPVSLASTTSKDLPTRVSQVAATWQASIYLCSDGTVMSSGQGTSGELGLGKDMTLVSQATTIQTVLPRDIYFTHIASSMAHTVAVASNGQVWGWGRGRKGQLGEPAQDVWRPRRIDGITFPVVKAVCGKDFTCLIGSKSTGKIAVLGPSRHDRFGIRDAAPKAVPGWRGIEASWGSVYVLKDDGSVVAWGRNDHGQLPHVSLPPIQSLASGSEHCVGFAKDGQVYAWGWGEHGNCGVPTDQDGDVKAPYNKIDVTGTVLAVFAGCATSFVITNDH